MKSEDDTEEGRTWLSNLAGWLESHNTTSAYLTALWLHLLSEWDRLLPPFQAVGTHTLWLFIGHWDLCACLCGAVCVWKGESRTETEGTGQRANVVVRICVCVCHSVPVLSEWAVKHVSQGYSNLITKPVVIHHVPYKSQLPLEGCNRIGILQILSDPAQMLHAWAVGLNQLYNLMHFLPLSASKSGAK